MNDILPPRRPPVAPDTLPPVQPTLPPAPQQMMPVAPEVTQGTPESEPALPPRRKRRLWAWIVLGVVVLLAIVCTLAVTTYYRALEPVSRTSLSTTRVTISPNTSSSQIATLLHGNGLIRSETAFSIYTRLIGAGGKFRAGAYNISAASSTQDIVQHLITGKTDTMRITFLPGAALRPNPATPEAQRTDIESVLLRVGFKQADIEAAFVKTYQHPLFAGRPAGGDIEGYVYGETYDFTSDATLDDVFGKVFDTYYGALQKTDVVAGLAQHGLNLYQGITLASIIQREVSADDASTPSHDQQQVAQVFLLRLAKDMPLGSDVTAYYGAIKAGQSPTVAVDTPYNTRIHAGLPPGPIATPSIGALMAAAHPAAGDYLFFLSGDDNMMYYARTDAEHQANIRGHCQTKCAIP